MLGLLVGGWTWRSRNGSLYRNAASATRWCLLQIDSKGFVVFWESWHLRPRWWQIRCTTKMIPNVPSQPQTEMPLLGLGFQLRRFARHLNLGRPANIHRWNSCVGVRASVFDWSAATHLAAESTNHITAHGPHICLSIPVPRVPAAGSRGQLLRINTFMLLSLATVLPFLLLSSLALRMLANGKNAAFKQRVT